MASHLSPTNPGVLRFMTRYNPDYRVEIEPGVYRRISPVTGEPETHITVEGLEHLRRKQRRAALSERRKALDSEFDPQVFVAVGAIVSTIPRPRSHPDLATIMRRCGKIRARQARVRR